MKPSTFLGLLGISAAYIAAQVFAGIGYGLLMTEFVKSNEGEPKPSPLGDTVDAALDIFGSPANMAAQEAKAKTNAQMLAAEKARDRADVIITPPPATMPQDVA